MLNTHNIYSSHPSESAPEKESNKISYWLEKLFNQEETKNKDVNSIHFREEKQEADRIIVKEMVQNSNTILMSISTVFPFSFFQTTINVEATRITLITRQLLASQVHSIDIKDISSIFIETSILFAAINLITKTYAQKEFKVKGLWKKEAIMLRRIIEGLRMFEKRNINITHFSRDELLGKLQQLSSTKIVL